MLILNGCSRTVVKTVKVDSFCEGRYESLWLVYEDIDNLIEIRSSEKYKVTMDKYIDYHVLNEKEYQLCLGDNGHFK